MSKLQAVFAAAALSAALSSPLGSAEELAGRSADRNRIVRVVTISQNGLTNSEDDLLEKTIERLDRAASYRPDIAALPEVFLPGVEEVAPGPVTKRLAEWARANSSYVLFGLRTRSSDTLYNSAILLDRQGRLVGRYNKIRPTEGELSQGVYPGDPDPPVFETDFGKIGVQICFDVNWWDQWARLKEKGAKIVFFPAAYPAARQLSALALRNQYFVVSSSRDRHSRVYDITGEVIALSGRFQRWAGAELPVGKRLFEIDFHTKKIREMQKKYGPKVEVKWYHEDDWFTLASRDPNLTVEDLIEDYGLVPLDDYRRRATQAVDEARQRGPNAAR